MQNGVGGAGCFLHCVDKGRPRVCEVEQWVKQDHQYSQKYPAQEEHSWEQRLAQLRLRWESCKKPKAHHSDTTEGSKEKQQSQWLGLASQNVASQKQPLQGTGNRLTSQDCAKAGQRQMQL